MNTNLCYLFTLLLFCMSFSCKADNYPYTVSCPTQYKGEPLRYVKVAYGRAGDRHVIPKYSLQERGREMEEQILLPPVDKVWILCGYREGIFDELFVAKALPRNLTECIVRYQSKRQTRTAGIEVKRIACK